MTEDDKYLQKMANIFGFGRNPKGLTEEEDKYEETPSEMLALLDKKGLEVASYGDIGDSMFCLFEDGELKLTAYISTRGSMYQAGAFDGDKEYSATNVGLSSLVKDQWAETRGTICGEIAKGAWKDVQSLKEEAE